MEFSPDLQEFCQYLVSCYRDFSGSDLLDSPVREQYAWQLYSADFVVLAHRVSADPVFCYANLQAQKLWEMDWDEFTQTPSRNSAPEFARAERKAHMDSASARNIITNFDGVRVSKSGKLFRIRDVTLWNVFDAEHRLVGQAAKFDPSLVEFIR